MVDERVALVSGGGRGIGLACVRRLLADGERGTQREDLGGRSFTGTGPYIFRLAAGEVIEERAHPDIAGLRKQLSGRP